MNSRVLITGATSGIGLDTALFLASKGYQVIATGRTVEKTQIIHTCANEAGVSIDTVLLDVTDPISIASLKENVLALTGGYGVDVVINNAGYAEGGSIEDIPLERLYKQFETNVFGLVSVSQQFIPTMRERGFGKIINISSVLGKVTIPLMGAYTASKHAVEALSDAMRIELASEGIQVVIIAPGPVQTNFTNSLVESLENWPNEKQTSPYQTVYTKFKRDRQNDKGAHPRVISQTILQAIQSKHPKPRYAVPFRSVGMSLAHTIFPTKVFDKILRKVVFGK